MMTSLRCSQILTKCGICYSNCCSLLSFDNTVSNGKCNFSTGNSLRKKSHYDVLGLSPKATQVDVKSAYYSLSKVYYPDRNEGSTEAAEKFRDITSAYEILGNYKLRRLYDKGIIHTAGAQYHDPEEETVEVKDDPQTQFYKRHMKRTETPTASGRPIFDFDEWNSQHYGKAFERNQAARKRFYDKPKKVERELNSSKSETLIFGGLALMTVVLYLIVQFDLSSKDVVSDSTKVR